jgi:hypothetical protein
MQREGYFDDLSRAHLEEGKRSWLLRVQTLTTFDDKVRGLQLIARCILLLCVRSGKVCLSHRVRAYLDLSCLITRATHPQARTYVYAARYSDAAQDRLKSTKRYVGRRLLPGLSPFAIPGSGHRPRQH